MNNKKSKKIPIKEAIKLHRLLCKDLGIPATKIKILKQNPNCKQSYATYKIKSKTIVLWEETILKHKKDWQEAIAHETYHHFQLIKGWLKSRTWKGKPRSSFSGYRSLPWERGAFRFAKKIKSQLGASK